MIYYGVWDGEMWFGETALVWYTSVLCLAHAQRHRLAVGYDEENWRVREIGADGFPVEGELVSDAS